MLREFFHPYGWSPQGDILYESASVFRKGNQNYFPIFVFMQRTPWTERKFNFDFPVTHFPFILERLRGTAPRIGEMIQGLKEEALCRKPAGKWSIKEHIGHLIDLETLHDGRIDDFRNKLTVLRAADMTNKKTNEADHNKTSIKELLQSFRKTRIEFIQRLLDSGAEALSYSALHPRLNKPMRMVDMAFFVAEHDDQHLAIMREMVHC